MTALRLHPMTDSDFAWLFVPDVRTDGLALCEGGIAPDEVTNMLRGIAAQPATNTARPVAWMIIDQDWVIGMLSYTKQDEAGRYEIGYGLAPAYEGRGYATAALALLLDDLTKMDICELFAETSVDNPASQRVLEKNGFVQFGKREDAEDGGLICWAISLVALKRTA